MIITLHTDAETKLRDAAPALAKALIHLIGTYELIADCEATAARAALVLAGVEHDPGT